MHELKKLENGLRLFGFPMNHAGFISLRAYVRCGGRDENTDTNGISHLIEHMAFNGTQRLNAEDIILGCEQHGIMMNAYTSNSMTCYMLEGTRGHLPFMLEMLSEMVLKSTFPEHKLRNERKVVLQELEEDLNDDGALAQNQADANLYGDHPLGMTLLGPKENLLRFTSEDLLRYRNTHYVGENLVVCATGDFDAEMFFADASRLFAEALSTPAASRQAPILKVGAFGHEDLDTTQSHVNLAWKIPHDKEMRLKVAVTSALLSGGMSAPLFTRFRDDMGIAYEVDTTPIVMADTASMHFDTVTTPENLDSVIPALKDVMTSLQKEIPAVQFSRAINSTKYALMRTFGSASGYNEYTGQTLINGGEILDHKSLEAKLDALTPEDLQSILSALMNTPVCLSIYGAGCGQEKATDMLGQWTSA